MSMPRKADAAAYLRQRAVELCRSGHRHNQVARLLGVSVRSVQRWNSAFETGGRVAVNVIDSISSSGRPPKLTIAQTQEVLSWIIRDPTEFGFANSWWTAARLAALIQRRLGVSMNHRYLSRWLLRYGFSAQVPGIQPAERNQANFVPTDIMQIDEVLTSTLTHIRHDQTRLRSFFLSSPLPWTNTTLLM